jgi:hypothetical protein
MRTLLFAALVVSSACAHGTSLITRKPSPEEARVDSLYWSAVANLDPANKSGTLDTGIAKLDAYLASPGQLKHKAEAQTLRSLARNSQQLARVEAALQQAKASAADSKSQQPEAKSSGRDEETVKEIQRLKEELAKANEELERIKKRLAAPKP